MVQFLTLYLATQAVIDINEMSDPQITQYLRPLSLQDRQDLGVVNFADYGFVLVKKESAFNLETGEISNSGIPPEVGSIQAFSGISIILNPGKPANGTWVEFGDCKKYLPQKVVDSSAYFIRDFIYLEEHAFKCLDPTTASTSYFKDYIGNGDVVLQLIFKFCEDNSFKDPSI